MEYQLVNDGATEKEIEFTVGAHELNPYIDGSLEKVRNKVTIRGYRKGRAPKSLIRKRYYDTLKAEAINDLILEMFRKVLQEKNWKPIGEPELVDYNEDTDIKFRLRFEIMPEFEVDNYLNLELFKEQPLPVEYLYEQTINRMRENYATVVETTLPAAVDDYVTLDMEVSEDNKIIEKQNDIVLRIGDRSLPDELNRALVGVKKGDKKDVAVDKKTYRIRIKKVEERVLPQVNEDFAKLLNFASLSDMQKGIKEMLQKEEEERLNDELREHLARVILERIQFNVPKSLVEREYQAMLKRNNLTDNDSNREKFLPIAEKRVRFNLILDRIAQKENISALDDKVTEMAESNKLDITSMDEELKEYLRRIVVREEVVQFLLKNARIVQKGRILSPEEVKNADRPVRH